MSLSDPYQLDPAKIEDPPTSLAGCIKHPGLGFVLSASIVGSGELVATTTAAAKAGFMALWGILFVAIWSVVKHFITVN
ncbi:MAG: manganese transport protein [Verrucomicrobiales bacterium]|jgi:manganese transport protein